MMINIALIGWPSLSPDLNLVDNMWGILARKVYQNNRQFQTVSELQAAILQGWVDIDVIILKSLITSMPTRILEVIRRNGCHIKYKIINYVLLIYHVVKIKILLDCFLRIAHHKTRYLTFFQNSFIIINSHY